MFVTQKRFNSLHRELQQLRLIVDRLRRDMNRAQGHLRRFEGWGDDFIKTWEVADPDTRVFVRPEAGGALSVHHPDTPIEHDAPESEVMAQSAVRRRMA